MDFQVADKRPDFIQSVLGQIVHFQVKHFLELLDFQLVADQIYARLHVEVDVLDYSYDKIEYFDFVVDGQVLVRLDVALRLGRRTLQIAKYRYEFQGDDLVRVEKAFHDFEVDGRLFGLVLDLNLVGGVAAADWIVRIVDVDIGIDVCICVCVVHLRCFVFAAWIFVYF
jgi:hypothetical protein